MDSPTRLYILALRGLRPKQYRARARKGTACDSEELEAVGKNCNFSNTFYKENNAVLLEMAQRVPPACGRQRQVDGCKFKVYRVRLV